MDDFELRLLTKEEAYIDEEDETKTTALKVLQKQRAVFAINTDLTCLTGDCNDAKMETNYSLQPDLKKKKYYFVDDDGELNEEEGYDRVDCVRPVLHFINLTINRDNLFYDNHGIPKLKFGEYPQSILEDGYVNDEKIINGLNEKLMNQTLKKTGKTYCFYYGDNGKPFSIRYGTEYLYEGKKYMPFTATYGTSSVVCLSSDEEICPSMIYWLKVEPITWLYDEDTGLLISEKALVAGIGFEQIKKGNDFESTEMYEFLNTHMRRDIIPSRVMEADKSSLLDGSESLKKYVYKRYGKRG